MAEQTKRRRLGFFVANVVTGVGDEVFIPLHADQPDGGFIADRQRHRPFAFTVVMMHRIPRAISILQNRRRFGQRAEGGVQCIIDGSQIRFHVDKQR